MKKIMVTRSSLPPFEEYKEMIEKLWVSRWLTNEGEFHREFEDNLKIYLGCKNITLFTNGHMALDLCIKAMEITGEVITTPFTFASTTHALVMNGITPVYCDIKQNDFCIDENKLEELITEKTSAILAVHVYGQICNNKKLEEIAKKHKLKLIYDGAHAFGVTVNKKSIAEYGDATMYSFHATKVFHTIEGGALSSGNKDLKEKLKMLKNFGIRGPEDVELPGTNAKMNEFAAAMGICNLKRLKEDIAKRKILVEKYVELLSVIEGVSFIDYKNNKIRGVEDNYSYLPVVIHEEMIGFNRDELFEFLETKDIYTRKYFYPLITDFACYKGKYKEGNLDIAKRISKKVLTLPLYSELSLPEVEYICECIVTMYKMRNR